MSNLNTPVIRSEDGFYKYLSQINSVASLTQEEEFALAKKYLEEHDINAAHQLVMSHLKLVVKIAMRYRHYGLPIADIVSEGNIGLMQAVKKYQPDTGNRLSTYAMWWIKAAIQEYVLRSWSLVKIGTTAAQKKLFFSLNKVKNKIADLNSRPVNSEDYSQIATELGVTTKEVDEMNKRLAGADISLNQPALRGEESGGEMIDLLSDNRVSPELGVISMQISSRRSAVLSEAIQILNPREAQILTARKLQEVPSTLDTLSIEYNISKERVRQIENQAFNKVQNYILDRLNSEGEEVRA